MQGGLTARTLRAVRSLSAAAPGLLGPKGAGLTWRASRLGLATQPAPMDEPTGWLVSWRRFTRGMELSTGCSLNIVFFRIILNILDSVFPRSQCVYTHTQAGRKPALQQNWQSSEKS